MCRLRYLQARKALEAPLKWGAFYSKCMNISDLFSACTQAGQASPQATITAD